MGKGGMMRRLLLIVVLPACSSVSTGNMSDADAGTGDALKTRTEIADAASVDAGTDVLTSSGDAYGGAVDSGEDQAGDAAAEECRDLTRIDGGSFTMCHPAMEPVPCRDEVCNGICWGSCNGVCPAMTSDGECYARCEPVDAVCNGYCIGTCG